MDSIRFEWDENKNLFNQEKLISKRNNITQDNYKNRGEIMREHYDFSNGRPNPYVKRLKKQITININNDTIDYFKEQAESSGIPYQTLINLYLSECADKKKQLQTTWL